MRPSLTTLLCTCLSLAIAAAACDDHGHKHNENEVFTTVILTFTPSGGGTPFVATVNDPDGDGGGAPTIDPISLSAGTFNLTVKFENRLETPAEDITVEVMNESDQHQLFFTNTAVNGPASNQTGAPLTQAYGDMDAKGLPIGLTNSVTAAKGTGTLTVTLRHMPPLNDKAVKVAGLAMMVRDGGFSAIGGSTDVQVSFPVTVQ